MNANKQNIYIFFNGMGKKEFFTSENDINAKEFIKKERGEESYFTIVRTTLEIVASRTYFISEYKIFDGIEI